METLKVGQEVNIYVNPNKCECLEGRAKLIKRLEKSGGIELWEVEFLDQPGKTYPRFIKAEKPTTWETNYYQSMVFDLNNFISKLVRDEV